MKPRRLFYVDVNSCLAVNKEKVRSIPSSRRRCISTHMMEMIAPNTVKKKRKMLKSQDFSVEIYCNLPHLCYNETMLKCYDFIL